MDFDKFAKAALDKAQALDCAAELYYVEGESALVKVRRGEVADFKTSATLGVGVRVTCGRQTSYVSTNALREPETLIQKAVDNAALISLFEEQPLQPGGCNYPAVPKNSNAVEKLSANDRIKLAKEIERRTLAQDPRVKRVIQSSVSTSRQKIRIVNTLGLDTSREKTEAYSFVSPVLEQGETVDGFAFRANEHALELDALAREAVQDAAMKLGAQSVPAGTYAAILKNDAAAQLLSAFWPVFSAEREQRGLSPYLSGKEFSMVAPRNLDLIDEPMLFSNARAFDSEGVPSVRTRIIAEGCFQGFLHNLKTAKKAGKLSTSNGGRAGLGAPVRVVPSNLFIAAGSKTPDDLFRLLNKGLYITSLSGLHAGANPVSGEFSLLARGMLVENGHLTTPVNQITVAGNFFDLLKNIALPGNDLRFLLPSGGRIGSPSLLLGGIAVSGR